MFRAVVLLFCVPLSFGPAMASEPSLAQRYVRMRAAGAAGNATGLGVETAALLAREPADLTVATQVYRQAIAVGDAAVALKAGRILDGQGMAPPDAPLLFLIDAVNRRDWVAARADADRLDKDKLFAFLVPALRAWIAFGSGQGDPLTALEAAHGNGLAGAYYAPQRALLLLALGRAAEGAALVRTMDGAGSRLRLLAAAAALKAGRRAEAEALLAGNDDILEAARRRLAAGGRLDIATANAGDGIGELLTQVALDFGRQQLAPVGSVLARLATFSAPDNASAWIACASFLGKANKTDAALDALSHVRRADPFQLAADTLRVAFLIDRGDRKTALDIVLAEARRPGAGAAQWGRAGDVYLAADRPAEAADAYGRAIAIEPDRADVWTLWLQKGAALELAGDWPAARTALEKAHALAPDQPLVLNHLGYSELSRHENIAAATRLIEQASRLRPDDPAITDSLGWAYYLRGDIAGALPLLERASGGDPAEATINEHLGDAYWTAGRRIEARYAWRAALVTAENKDGARIRAKLAGGLTAATGAP